MISLTGRCTNWTAAWLFESMYTYNLAIRFEHIVESYPGHIALWFNEHETYSYIELNQRANRLARLLQQEGLDSGDVVCISGSKSIHTFSLMLACLKLGIAYSIFDPDSPLERLRKIFLTCRPHLVAAEGSLLNSLDNSLTELLISSINADELVNRMSSFEDTNMQVSATITGTTPAYIMFTSGSTGVPKGAVMTHVNVLNLLAWSRVTYRITPADILTNLNPLYFDNSVFDFYSSIFNGACLVPFSKQETRNPKVLVEKIDAAGCTLWFSVPSLLIFLQTLKATDGRYLRSIKRFVFGGEGYPKPKLKALFDIYSNTSEFFNVSGPTECTCICSSYKITVDDFVDLQGFPPLGSIASNFSYLILDDENKIVPDGELGELCLLGPNVGLGYYNDPERTAANFVQNPYNEVFREIMYKTGDLIRLDTADGKLYIHGRKDNQIKHMGYRIELEEIENALHRIPYVMEAVALHSNSSGSSRITAVVAVRQPVGDDQIRQDLRKLIPDYMIPSQFYYETVLPKNSNGKVDRKQLKEKYLTPDGERQTK
ncbi:MAG: amino acid adenylation domain-containing protein [Chloroflexota bacterium]